MNQIIEERVKEAIAEFAVLPNMDDLALWRGDGESGIFDDFFPNTDMESEGDENNTNLNDLIQNDAHSESDSIGNISIIKFII